MTRRKVFDPEQVSADFWRQGDVRVALSRRDVGQLFHLYLQAHADCTQTQLALLTEHDRSDISNWVRGVRQPRVSDIEVMVRIADGLRIPDDARVLLGIAPVAHTTSSAASISPTSVPAPQPQAFADDEGRPGRPRKLEIAVPPFTAMANEPDELGHVLEGFRNHVVSELSRLPNTMITTPAGDEVPGSSEVRLVLVASAVRIEPKHLSLTLRLTNDPGQGASPLVWSRSFVLDSDHLVEAYATIPAQIADALGATLEQPPAHERSRIGPNAESYESFLRASHLIETNRLPDLLTATALLRHVVDVTPTFADGHALYGYALWRAYFSGWAFAEVDTLAEALSHARRALALDPDSTWGRMTLVRLYWDLGRHEEAIAEGVRAVQDAPGSSSARLVLARALNNAGMAELALSLTEDVLAVDERNLTAQKLRIWNLLMAGEVADASRLGLTHNAAHSADANTAWATTMALTLTGDTDAAQAVAEESLRSDQSSAMLWLLMGYVQRHAGRADDALRTWQRGIAMVHRMAGTDSRNFRVRAALANMLACVGQSEAAADVADIIEAEEPLNAYLLYRTAHIRAALGETGSAVDLIDRARRTGFLSVQMLQCEQQVCALASLGDIPEYDAVVRTLDDDVSRLRAHYEPILRTLISG